MAQDEASKKSHENMAFKIASNVAQGFFKIGPQRITQIFKEVEKLTPGMSGGKWDDWCDGLAAEPNPLCDQDTANTIKEFSDQKFPWGAILMVMTILKVRMADLEAVMNIYTLDRQYKYMGKTTPHPAPVEALIRSAIIDPGRTTENRVQLKKHGYDEEQINNLFLAAYRTLDEGTLRILYLRDEIDETRLYERMRELGYTDTRTGEMVKTWRVIPGPQDLLHMTAKEAFEPEMYTRLGLEDDFPSEHLSAMASHGVSEYWARKWWIAHWDQPSIGQGFEMLHRDEATLEEIDLLFRAVEMPPYWRQKLINIAYRPLTRVDVRRMFEMDIMDEQQVFDSYRFHGYNVENADFMTRFTVAYKNSHEKELTRGAILESYNEGMISRTEAMNLLLEQDYSNDLADYYLTLEDFNRGKDLQKQRIANTRDELLINRITAGTARTRLNQMGLRGETIDMYLETWELDRYQFQALPSKGELDNFLLKGIITQGQWRDVMHRHGYSGPHVQWYLDEMQRELEVTRRMPTKADLIKWFKANSITEAEYREDMGRLGYAEKYINLYMT